MNENVRALKDALEIQNTRQSTPRGNLSGILSKNIMNLSQNLSSLLFNASRNFCKYLLNRQLALDFSDY